MNMIRHWFELLRSGFSHRTPADPLDGEISRGSFSNLSILKPYLQRHKSSVAAGAAVILAAALLSFPMPMLTRFLVDNVILGKRLDLLLWVVLAIVAVRLFSSAAGMAETYIFTRLQNDISLDLQRNLLDHTMELPKAFFDDKEVGYLMSRVSHDAQGITWFFSQTTLNILSNIIRLIGGSVFLFFLEWRLALVSMLVLPLLVLVVRVFSGRMRALSHQGMEQWAQVSSRFQETLSSIPLIKAFSTEKKESERVMGELKASQRINLEQNVAWSLISSVFSIVPDIAKGVSLILGVIWIINSEWTLGSLLAFISYLGYVFGPAMSLANVNIELQNSLAALDRVSVLLNAVPEDKGGGLEVAHLRGEVSFERVDFAYNNTQKVLEDLTFEVKPGENIAIVGASGVGKTTLISLLLRFYKPTGGVIRFDGVEAGEYDLQSLRRRLGYVSQSTQMMAGTIREILNYGSEGATEEQLLHAAQVAGIADFILGLPGKFDSPVGEKGVNLSEGQKQRLSIARALIKDPDILIMDEPTAALDSIVERSIFDALPEEVKNKTLFIAAHRLSTIKRADRIIVLEDKHLVGFGTHEELISSDAYYRSLMDAF